jgi:hypothetical protein
VNNRGQARLLRRLRADAPGTGAGPAADSGAAAASASIDALGYAVLGQVYDAAVVTEIHDGPAAADPFEGLAPDPGCSRGVSRRTRWLLSRTFTPNPVPPPGNGPLRSPETSAP